MSHSPSSPTSRFLFAASDHARVAQTDLFSLLAEMAVTLQRRAPFRLARLWLWDLKRSEPYDSREVMLILMIYLSFACCFC